MTVCVYVCLDGWMDACMHVCMYHECGVNNFSLCVSCFLASPKMFFVYSG